MKNLLKNSIVLVSLLLVFAFTACSNSSNADSGSSEVKEIAVYTYKKTGLFNYEYSLIFYSNNNYVLHHHDYDDGDDYDSSKGTYSGNPNKDGTVELKETHCLSVSKTWYEYPSPRKHTLTIKNGSFDYEVVSNKPLTFVKKK